ncbi:MAG: succinate dehydrogenase cytochrome b subunit [Longimicrobiales bacterium]
MRRIFRLWRTTIGKKYVMAVSGIVLLLWLFLHAAGNLKIFTGRSHFNEYSEFLRAIGAPVAGEGDLLWVTRAVLLVALAAHVWAMIALWRLDAAARPVGYRQFRPQVFSVASRTMKWGGIAIFLFVIYHLLHFTTGDAHADFVTGDPYHNVIAGFQSLPVALVYFAALVALAFHLYHGIWSAFQTLGVNDRRYNRLRRPFALLVSIGITTTFAVVPIAVLAGIVP